MATRNEIAAVYTAGVIQGVALVTFPATSNIFTSANYYDLSSTAYGAMFLPQAVMAIIASLAGAGLGKRWGVKRTYLIGLAADLVSMILLVLSSLFMANQSVAYGILLLATACLGIGFGLTVPALNTFADVFFPEKVDRAVLILNALLGLGTALAPVFVAVFAGLGIWWGLPVLVSVLLAVLIVFSMRLPLQTGIQEVAAKGAKTKLAIPKRFWIFAAFALLYGIVETMNGNWATIYMSEEVGASTTMASLALTVFWLMVTVGRVFFALVERRFPEQRTYRFLPFVVAAAFVLLAFLPKGSAWMGIVAFGIAGFGCSALLPLTISFGQKELTAITAAVAGGLIAFYQMGYGIAAFGVGPLEERAGMSLNVIYGWATIVALALGALAFVLAGKRREVSVK